MATQVLVRLPDELARRFTLYRAALAVEKDAKLAAEMAESEKATIEDGICLARATASSPPCEGER
jgi:hypothetical protein